MRSIALALLLAAPAVRAQDAMAPYRDAVAQIQTAALADSTAYGRIAYVADTFGHRLSGTAALEATIDWAIETMRADGLEGVRGQPVMVPHWVRGAESAAVLTPAGERPLVMLGLGGSIATPPEGITAEVLVVSSFDDLAAHAAEARGRIVLFDVPFTGYGETVRYRGTGAVEAARLGAVASLIRSVGPYGLRTPHTGSMRYADDAPRIPGAALALEDAMMLHRMQDRGQRPTVRLTMSAQWLPDALSRNVIGEVRGREHPEEVVLLACHIDSWDVGTGSVDDMGGCAVAWESVRTLARLGLRPRRTVRAVLFTNEENGTRGGRAYRDSLGTRVNSHVFALESDGGVFAPVAVGVTASDEGFATVQSIEPLMEAGVAGAHLNTAAERYFWVHHTPADTPDKLDPAEVSRNVAVMATVAYVLAEMPERLPVGPPAHE